jgi:hypothetical protein
MLAALARAAGLTHALAGLWPKFFPYALSFYMLGSTWLANIKLRSKTEFLRTAASSMDREEDVARHLNRKRDSGVEQRIPL